MKIIEMNIVKASKSKIAEELKKKYKDSEGTIYLSEKQSKPNGVWKKLLSRDEIDFMKYNTYFVKSATFYGASEIWAKIADSNKVVLQK